MTLSKLISRLEEQALIIGGNVEVLKVIVVEDHLLLEYDEGLRVNMQDET